MSETDEGAAALAKLSLELRRGALTVAVLGQLRAEHYGYSLRQRLAAHGVEIDEGTLYPLIRRLENQGLLVSEWREEDKRRKRFYQLSEIGAAVLDELVQEWASLTTSVGAALAEGTRS